jgi:3-oxoacyl-(acyl-carrier-protein) synthase
MGLVTAAGWTLADTWEALQTGRSGLRSLSLFASERCGDLLMGEVQGDAAARSQLPHGSRSDQFAVWAATEAWRAAGLAAGTVRPERAGVVLGALTGGMMFIHRHLSRLFHEGVADPAHLAEVECCHSALCVAEQLGLTGFQTTVSNACASGGAALSVACDLLSSGEADVVLAGGVDSLNIVLVNGFNSLLLIAKDGCRPFDRDRQGMTVGEGAGVLVIETEAHARERGAPICAYLAGVGNSCDAHHATAPEPQGKGLSRAIEQALRQAGVPPAAVGYVNAHGTGTVDNDLAEANALRQVFGEHVPPFSSTKGYFGHAMAAAGAIEAIVTILALQHQALPPNAGFQNTDPAIGLTPVRTLTPAPIDFALSTSLGFGGNNSAVVFGRARPENT